MGRGRECAGMRITDLRARALRIPFKVAFKHASAERRATQTVWVRGEVDGTPPLTVSIPLAPPYQLMGVAVRVPVIAGRFAVDRFAFARSGVRFLPAERRAVVFEVLFAMGIGMGRGRGITDLH